VVANFEWVSLFDVRADLQVGGPAGAHHAFRRGFAPAARGSARRHRLPFLPSTCDLDHGVRFSGKKKQGDERKLEGQDFAGVEAVIFRRSLGPTVPRALRVATALVCAAAFTATVGWAGSFSA